MQFRYWHIGANCLVTFNTICVVRLLGSRVDQASLLHSHKAFSAGDLRLTSSILVAWRVICNAMIKAILVASCGGQPNRLTKLACFSYVLWLRRYAGAVCLLQSSIACSKKVCFGIVWSFLPLEKQACVCHGSKSASQPGRQAVHESTSL
eukprot:3381146-Amphidinium_carterae.1